MAVDVFVDTSATYNGDGTSATQATADGGPGAYNNLQDALNAAPNKPSSGSEHHIWVRRQNILVTATLSPTTDGSSTAHHKIIGWPISVSKIAQSVDSVPTGTDSLGFSNASWQFVDAALTEGFNYWQGATITFTSGSNNGLSRMVIWFDDTTDTIYLDFPLPNDISVGDTYDIALEAEYYSQRPQSGIDAGWDGDALVMPKIDGNGGSYHILNFSGDQWWELCNFDISNTANANYAVIDAPSSTIVKFVKLYNAGKGMNSGNYVYLEKAFLWDFYSGNVFITSSNVVANNSHFDRGPNGPNKVIFSGSGHKIITNCTFGRVHSMNGALVGTYPANSFGYNILATNPFFDTFGSSYYLFDFPLLTLERVNSIRNNFHHVLTVGEIYDLDADATIVPPSGASNYIKMLPNSYLRETILKFRTTRYQASGSKIYTWKFRPTGWTALATSDIEVWASYLSESLGSYRIEVTANPAAVTNDTWNDLSITIPAGQDGIVYFEIRLKKYESASAWIALDPKVDVV